MGFSIGPFQVITIIILYAVLFLSAVYCIIKKRMGILSILTVLIFPFAGSLIIVLYSISNWKEKELLK